jgi:hypothetical protein
MIRTNVGTQRALAWRGERARHKIERMGDFHLSLFCFQDVVANLLSARGAEPGGSRAQDGLRTC